MCGPKVKNRVLILITLVSNRVWFLHSSLKSGMFFLEATFSSLSIGPSIKALYNPFNIGR